MENPETMNDLLQAQVQRLEAENKSLKEQIESLQKNNKENQDAIKEKDIFLQTIYHNSDVGIYMVDVLENGSYRFNGINPAHERLLGVKNEQLEGKGVEVLKEVFNSETMAYVKAQYDRVVETKTTQYVETQIKLHGKDTSWFRGLKPILDDTGKVVRIIATATPITELRNLEKDKQHLEKQLRQAQKMEAIGVLAGGIAHDFNNILYPLLGYTDVLIHELPKDSLYHGYANEILKAGLRAKDLTQQILSFSRQRDQELQPVKIQAVVEEACALLDSTIPKTIAFKTRIQPDCKAVMADATQIHQIIINLVTNAYQAMSENGGLLKLVLQQIKTDLNKKKNPAGSGKEYVMLQVSDSGTGIEKAHLEMIFDPYFTTKDKDNGTGLGLSVVHGIVKQFKGIIKVFSKPKKGTTIKVYLPIIQSEERNTPVQLPPKTSHGSETIFLVDDEIDITKIGKIMLGNYGYNVIIETSSIKALERFKQSPDIFDIIISDMTMPGLTGLELSEEIKKIRKDIPVLICSGFNDKINAKNVHQFNVEGFLEKPLVMKDVSAKIRSILDK